MMTLSSVSAVVLLGLRFLAIFPVFHEFLSQLLCVACSNLLLFAFGFGQFFRSVLGR